MKRGFFKIMLLLGFAWVLYANIHLLDQLTKRFHSADQEIKTKMEMIQVSKCVQMYFVDNNRLPTTEEFPVMIRECTKDEGRKLLKDAAVDIWGTYYWLAVVKAGFYVVSAGPDKKWSTKDDVSFYQTMGNLGLSEPAATPVQTVKTVSGSSSQSRAQTYVQPRQGYSAAQRYYPAARPTAGSTSSYSPQSAGRSYQSKTTSPKPILRPQPFQSQPKTDSTSSSSTYRQ